MKKYSLVLFCLLAFFLDGCLLKSLHPFYKEKDIVFMPELTGSWLDQEENQWSIEQYRKPTSFFLKQDSLTNSYKVVHVSSDGEKSIFNAHLFKLDGQFYFDFFPIIEGEIKETILSYHLTSTHSLAKVEKVGKNIISIKWFNENWLYKLFEENKIRLAKEVIKTADPAYPKQYVLTASTDELQKFIIKYGKDPQAFREPLEEKEILVFNLKRVHAN
jgi:hypothetical protein